MSVRQCLTCSFVIPCAPTGLQWHIRVHTSRVWPRLTSGIRLWPQPRSVGSDARQWSVWQFVATANGAAAGLRTRTHTGTNAGMKAGKVRRRMCSDSAPAAVLPSLSVYFYFRRMRRRASVLQPPHSSGTRPLLWDDFRPHYQKMWRLLRGWDKNYRLTGNYCKPQVNSSNASYHETIQYLQNVKVHRLY